MLIRLTGIMVALMVLSSTACGLSSSGEPQDKPSVEHSLFPATVTVSVEETVTVSGDLSIRLDRLEDQLCTCLPDQLCVWEGFAEADLALIDKDAELGAVMLKVGGRYYAPDPEKARTGIIGDDVLLLDNVLPSDSCDDPYGEPGVVITITIRVD